MEDLDEILFYTMDKAIKSYRQYAQKQLKAAGFTITVDQWLLLKAIQNNNADTQQNIAKKVFKDVASVTRIIDLLIKNGYLSRDLHSSDARRSSLALTPAGEQVLLQLQPFIEANRKKALKGLTPDTIAQLQAGLAKIAGNVT